MTIMYHELQKTILIKINNGSTYMVVILKYQ